MRQVKFRLNHCIHALERGRHHTDDREFRPVYSDSLADHIATAPEVSLPHSITDHGNRIAVSSLVFLREKGAAQYWLKPQHPEEIAADDKHERDPRLTAIVRINSRSLISG